MNPNAHGAPATQPGASGSSVSATEGVDVKWVAGLVVLGITLATLAEFRETEGFAVALGWAVAITTTFAYGEQAAATINKAVS